MRASGHATEAAIPVRHRILDWDSEFFGFGVARIDDPDLTEADLSAALRELAGGGVTLVYWPARRELGREVGERLGGVLADVKVTFAMDLAHTGPSDDADDAGVESWDESMPVRDVESLATQSGEYSRFARDPRFPREKFVALYDLWIRRSLRKEIADEVLVIRDSGRVAGMVTLGNKGGRGDIGLIAVDASSRGRRYGERLVRAAQRWFARRGYRSVQVVTQLANAPACGLYRKCGYAVESVEYFHHFWLQRTS